MNGTIKRLVKDRGFGFILAADGHEYFFHSTALQNRQFDSLEENEPVVFEPTVRNAKGPRAEDIRVVD